MNNYQHWLRFIFGAYINIVSWGYTCKFDFVSNNRARILGEYLGNETL